MGSPAWITGIFCPLLGCLICNVMWLSPMKAVLEVRRTGKIGSLNTLPFGFTIFNCIGWTMYGCLTRDYFIFWSNGPGLAYGIFYVLSTLPYVVKNGMTADEILMKNILEAMVVGSAFLWSYVGMICFIIYNPSDIEGNKKIIGYLSSACSLAYYASPLTTAVQVIKTRDASSLYAPLIATNLINATLWVFYGLLALNDIAVWLPNFVGGCLAIFQLALVLLFRKKTTDDLRSSQKAADSEAPRVSEEGSDTQYKIDSTTVNPLI